MKEKILKLRNEGKSYREIEKLLDCSRSLIAYHANNTTKEKALCKNKNNRFSRRKELKSKAGGECKICGYKKCLAALHFHHREPKHKKFEITAYIWGAIKNISLKELNAELEKCDLLCANCHAEVHFLENES